MNKYFGIIDYTMSYNHTNTLLDIIILFLKILD